MNNYPKLMLVKYNKEMPEESVMLVVVEDKGGYVCRVECNNITIYKWYGCAREIEKLKQ